MPGVGWKKLITEERITADIHRPVGWYTIAVSLVSINASARFGLNNVFAEGIGNVTFYATTTSTSESQINIISKSGKGSFPVENIRIKTDPDGTGAALQFYNNSEDNNFSLILFGDNEGNGVGNWELINFLPDSDNPGEDYNLNNTQWSNFDVSTIIDANTVNLGLSTTGNVTSAHVSASRLLINDELNPHIFSVGLDAGLGFLPEVHIGGTEAGTKTLISSPENGVFSSFGSNYPTIGLQFDPGPTPNVYIGNNDHYLGLAYLTDGTPEIQIKGESIKIEGPITHVGGLTTDSIVLSTNTAGSTSDEIVVRDSSGNLKTISNSIPTNNNQLLNGQSYITAADVDAFSEAEIGITMAREAGWEPAYSTNVESNVIWDQSEDAIKIYSPTDSTIGAAYRAVYMKAGEIKRFTTMIKGSVVDTNGVYLRLYQHNGDMPDGKTHVSNNAGTSSPFVQEDDTGITNWHENSSVSTSWVTYEYDYTAPSDGYVSLVVLNWSTYGVNTLWVKTPDIQTIKIANAVNTNNINSQNAPDGNFRVALIGEEAGYTPLNIDGNLNWDSTNDRLGIGTNSPTEKLHVVGDIFSSADIHANNILVATNIQHTGDSNTKFAFTPDSFQCYAGGIQMLTGTESTTDELVVNEGGVDMNFRVESNNNANLLFVDGGNDRIGINTNTPGCRLELKGTLGSFKALDAGNEIQLTRNNFNYITAGAYYGLDNANNTAGKLVLRTVDSSGTSKNTIELSENGEIFTPNIDFANGTHYVQYNSSTNELTYRTSTRKVKKNIAPATASLYDDVLNLSPSTFEWKNPKSTGTTLGLIAEEAAAINPLFTSYGPNFEYDSKTGRIQRNESGSKVIADDTSVPINVDWEAITTALIGKVKSLEQRLSKLENQ